MNNYRQIARTVTLADLEEIMFEWLHTGGTLARIDRDADGVPTCVVLIDHGQRIHATYTVGPVSDEPEPYISDEERARQTLIDQAHTLTEQFPDICIGTIHDIDGRISCWEVSVPALQWRPALPYGYCYTPWQLFNAVEDAVRTLSKQATSPEAFCS